MKFYSEVKYFENHVLGGGINVCTTEFKVLFNLNDIFNLLALEKPLQRRWKDQVEYEGVNFKRNGRSVYEPFIDSQNANFILTLYGNNIKEQLARKIEVEWQITNILKEYGDENLLIDYGNGDDLAYEFAIQNIKEFSRLNNNVLDSAIYVIENYPYKKYNRLDSTIQFDLEPESKEESHFKTFDELVEEVRNELKENKKGNKK